MYDVNMWAVLVAAVATFFIGMFWYSPALFGKKWLGYLGWTDERLQENMKKGMKQTMILAFIANLLTAFVLALLATKLGKTAVSEAFGLAFFTWLGFTGATTLGTVLWEKKPWGLWVLNNAYSLVTFIVMAVIVVLWK